jgi:hypothetical protein
MYILNEDKFVQESANILTCIHENTEIKFEYDDSN